MTGPLQAGKDERIGNVRRRFMEGPRSGIVVSHGIPLRMGNRARLARLRQERARRARTPPAARIGSAGEERKQFGEELAGTLQVRDVAAIGDHHALGAGNVLRGRGGQGGEVAEPGEFGRAGVLCTSDRRENSQRIPLALQNSSTDCPYLLRATRYPAIKHPYTPYRLSERTAELAVSSGSAPTPY